MPRYEFKEGSSSKFWQIELDGSVFTTTHGRIGTNGSVLKKSWPDEETAQKEYDKLIAQKTKKGYQLVSGGSATKKAPATNGAAKASGKAASKAAPATKPVAKKGKTASTTGATGKGGAFNASLAKKVDANPDDNDAWVVYADWLQSQGDPRGELAVVQEGLRTDPKNKALLSAEKKLLKDHKDAIVGPLYKWLCKSGKKDIPGITTKAALDADFRESDYEAAPVRVKWRAGFFSEVFIAHPGEDWTPPSARDDDDDDEGGGDDEESGSVDVSKLVMDILSHPVGRFCTALNLGMPNALDEGLADFGPVIKKLAAKGQEALGRLRTLYIGDIAREECEVSWIEIGDISKLYPSLKNLRKLTLRGGSDLKLGAINLPELRELTIITGGLDKKNVAAICAAKWPKLEKLELWFGSKSYGANTSLKDILPILDAKGFGKVKHLGLVNSELADEIAAALPKSKIIKQLEVLDLSRGTMTEAGVKSLTEGKSALANLKRLDLSHNYIGKAEKDAFKLTSGVRTKPQRTPSEWNGEQHRYAALGE